MGETGEQQSRGEKRRKKGAEQKQRMGRKSKQMRRLGKARGQRKTGDVPPEGCALGWVERSQAKSCLT